MSEEDIRNGLEAWRRRDVKRGAAWWWRGDTKKLLTRCQHLLGDTRVFCGAVIWSWASITLKVHPSETDEKRRPVSCRAPCGLGSAGRCVKYVAPPSRRRAGTRGSGASRASRTTSPGRAHRGEFGTRLCIRITVTERQSGEARPPSSASWEENCCSWGSQSVLGRLSVG